MSPNRSKQRVGRHRKKSAERAIHSIIKDVKQVNSLEIPESSCIDQRAKLVVKRPVVFSEDSPFASPSIQSIIDHKDNRLNIGRVSLGVSIINQRDSNRILRGYPGSLASLRGEVSELTEEFPDELYGFLGGVVITGVKPNRPGSRYVGLSLSKSLHDGLLHTVATERQKVLSPFADWASDRIDYQPVHHISLFRTDDQLQAESVRDELKASGIMGQPVLLGAPEVTLKTKQHMPK